MIVDAENAVAGRLASKIAKLLLEGYRIYVINIEKALITGSKERILRDFMSRLAIKSNVNPRRHGPFKPRSPEGIFRRMVRGMLPRRKPKGKEAFRRLRVYRGVPDDFKKREIIKFEDTNYRENAYGYITLYELSKLIGWMPLEERVGGGE
jgi:large subunit ribosomal protein L13